MKRTHAKNLIIRLVACILIANIGVQGSVALAFADENPSPRPEDASTVTKADEDADASAKQDSDAKSDTSEDADPGASTKPDTGANSSANSGTAAQPDTSAATNPGASTKQDSNTDTDAVRDADVGSGDDCTFDRGVDVENASEDWSNFRNSDSNMAITDVQTPVNTGDTSLLWYNILLPGGTAMNGGVPSPQIIVKGRLVTMQGDMIYALDMESGEVLVSGKLAEKTSFGLVPPIYVKEHNLIVCPLDGGVVQAVDADTLGSIWVYRDPLKGQANSHVTYADGYVYTGFWQGGNAAGLVCLDVTTGEPRKNGEDSWDVAINGGFYWTSAVSIGKVIVIGTDESTPRILSIDKETHQMLDSITLTDNGQSMGGQRSAISYDAASGRIYFTTVKGYMCSAKVSGTSGKISDYKKTKAGASSTSAPLLYKDVLYIGVGSGFDSGYFAAYDAATMKLLYKKEMKGAPKCSWLLSTAYESEGYLYFYGTYNYPPCGITVIKVPVRGASEKNVELFELYDADGFSEYGTCSIICSEQGVLFYKNDSGAIIAVGKVTIVAVNRLIDKLKDDYTELSKTDIIDIKVAKTAYDKLSALDKVLITSDRKAKLESAYALLPGDEKEDGPSDDADDPNKTDDGGGLGDSGNSHDRVPGGTGTKTLLARGRTLSLGLISIVNAESDLGDLDSSMHTTEEVAKNGAMSENSLTGIEAMPYMLWVWLGLALVGLLILLILIKKRIEEDE